MHSVFLLVALPLMIRIKRGCDLDHRFILRSLCDAAAAYLVLLVLFFVAVNPHQKKVAEATLSARLGADP